MLDPRGGLRQPVRTGSAELLVLLSFQAWRAALFAFLFSFCSSFALSACSSFLSTLSGLAVAHVVDRLVVRALCDVVSPPLIRVHVGGLVRADCVDVHVGVAS